MLDSNDIQLIITFLDRAEIKGHQERAAMNSVVNKLVQMANPPAEKTEEEK